MPLKLNQILCFLKDFAPLALAEDWDNVGLLVGDEDADIQHVMTCLTITPDVVDEAIATKTDLIVTHHPLLFRPVKSLTTHTDEGKMLLHLISHRIAVFSPHTAFDSAATGINQRLAKELGLTTILPVRPLNREGLPSGSGSGRYGKLKRGITLGQFLERVQQVLNIPHVQYVGELDRKVSRVAVACGAAAEYLQDAVQLGCDVLLTGEARFHSCLEARTSGIAMILAGHYATERPGVDALAHVLRERLAGVTVLASQAETDPVNWRVS